MAINVNFNANAAVVPATVFQAIVADVCRVGSHNFVKYVCYDLYFFEIKSDLKFQTNKKRKSINKLSI